MGKRKREADEDQDHDDKVQVPDADPALSNQISRLKSSLSRGIKSLHSTLKLARGFERQKLGRRQKSATDNPHQLLRLREEVIVLKQLDLERTAKQYLVKQLVRSTRTKSHPAVVSLYGPDPHLEQPKSTAEGNVLGRLFNSAPVKQVLPGLLNGLFDVLGVSAPGGGKAEDGANDQRRRTGKKSNVGAEPEPGSGSGSGLSENERSLVFSGDEVDEVRDESDGSFNGFSDGKSGDVHSDDDDDEPERPDYISDVEMDRLLSEHQDRLASSSDDDEEDGDDDRDDLDLSTRHTDGTTRGRSSRDDIAVSLSPEPQLSSRSKNTKRVQKAASVAPTSTSTSFLPSLSLGGYYSGSESGDDGDNDRDYSDGPPSAKTRNNRRGQRARQKIAEKKFGKNAKHLAKQKDKQRGQDSRNAGWDAQRGAVTGKQHGRDRFRNGSGRGVGDGGGKGDGRRDQRDQDARGSRAAPLQPKKRDDQGSLHPSWEAAKKRKAQGESQPTFAGRKITFD
ncbi:hypothetical protein PV08_07490 [Exophiala spinifera]|uniref:Bud22 domain-containing protein n=1 Tax=Exophiala spinifera TaxID=91928 RepID=A0A0D1YIE3_9EURO|nr:uncharacterized protein PV08_07490 [Exophiala spinifera]KIW14706.1 hypothetical protein PV08_07490 [Exophiala spinifera]